MRSRTGFKVWRANNPYLVSEHAILSEAKSLVAYEVSLSPLDASVATHLQNDSQWVCWKLQTHFLLMAHTPLAIIQSHPIRTAPLLKPQEDVFLYLNLPSRI